MAKESCFYDTRRWLAPLALGNECPCIFLASPRFYLKHMAMSPRFYIFLSATTQITEIHKISLEF
jgi:hypothetical protein